MKKENFMDTLVVFLGVCSLVLLLLSFSDIRLLGYFMLTAGTMFVAMHTAINMHKSTRERK